MILAILGDTQARRGRPDEAADRHSRALRIDPELAEARRGLAEVQRPRATPGGP